MMPRAQPEPRLEPLRTLWMARPPNKPITAGIFRVAYGHELRVTYGDEVNLLDSLLSRTDDAPLERRAEVIRLTLTENWKCLKRSFVESIGTPLGSLYGFPVHSQAP